MRKLIETNQSVLIKCDNEKCSYSIPYSNERVKYLVLFVNMPCPKCGENLLTEQDYVTYRNITKYVNFINKWFSWITIFYSKKNREPLMVHVHDGVNISKHED